MRCRKLVGLLLLVAVLTYGLVRPGAARADSLTTPLIISAGVAGGVAVILLIAILASSKDEPDFLDAFVPLQPRPEDVLRQRRLRYGLGCKSVDGSPALLCW
jgi:hypothetical protein